MGGTRYPRKNSTHETEVLSKSLSRCLRLRREGENVSTTTYSTPKNRGDEHQVLYGEIKVPGQQLSKGL